MPNLGASNIFAQFFFGYLYGILTLLYLGREGGEKMSKQRSAMCSSSTIAPPLSLDAPF